MPLIKCPVCDRDVSDAAASCPHCGHPLIAGPAGAAVPRAATQRRSFGPIGCLGVIGVIVVIAIAAGNKESVPQAPSCKSDWTLCTDNADMANNYSGWISAKAKCKSEANESARFGT